MSKSFNYHPSIRFAKLLRDQCKPLNLFKIMGFTHDISFQRGELSMLTSQEAIFRTWSSQRLPAFYTNEEGRTLKPGVYLGMLLDKNAQETRSIFLSKHSANQSLHIVEHDDDCQHMYHFAFNQSEAEFLHWTVNNIHLLHSFIENYKYSTNELINEVKKPINRIILPIDKTNQSQAMTKLDIPNLKIFHKDSKIPIYLSKQQGICLLLLFEGITAKQIASRMDLSYRTVEHYLERTRRILGCRSTKELISKYSNQINHNQGTGIGPGDGDSEPISRVRE